MEYKKLESWEIDDFVENRIEFITLIRKIEELLNVYTKEEYKRQGHSSNLIKLLINEARTKGISKIILDYTDEVYPLHKALGFKELDRQMEYRL